MRALWYSKCSRLPKKLVIVFYFASKACEVRFFFSDFEAVLQSKQPGKEFVLEVLRREVIPCYGNLWKQRKQFPSRQRRDVTSEGPSACFSTKRVSLTGRAHQQRLPPESMNCVVHAEFIRGTPAYFNNVHGQYIGLAIEINCCDKYQSSANPSRNLGNACNTRTSVQNHGKLCPDISAYIRWSHRVL